jgi:hypothetical protein
MSRWRRCGCRLARRALVLTRADPAVLVAGRLEDQEEHVRAGLAAVGEREIWYRSFSFQAALPCPGSRVADILSVPYGTM